MNARRHPEFIIIGAVKAATTWTAHQLGLNPALYVPPPEPHYFSTDYERGPGWYSEFFKDATEGAILGEKSADYLAHPEAATRIANDLPDTKLIVQLRNPVDRAYSDYCMLYRRGTIKQTPEKYFLEKSAHSERFLTSGLYAKSLLKYYDLFTDENIHPLLYDDIKDQPEQSIAAISAHIGVEPFIARQELEKRQNDSEAALLPLPMRQALKPLKKAAAPLRGNPLFENVRGIFARQVKYPPLNEKSRDFLNNYYQSDLKTLGNMIGRDLSSWLSAEPPRP